MFLSHPLLPQLLPQSLRAEDETALQRARDGKSRIAAFMAVFADSLVALHPLVAEDHRAPSPYTLRVTNASLAPCVRLNHPQSVVLDLEFSTFGAGAVRIASRLLSPREIPPFDMVIALDDAGRPASSLVELIQKVHGWLGAAARTDAAARAAQAAEKSAEPAPKKAQKRPKR